MKGVVLWTVGLAALSAGLSGCGGSATEPLHKVSGTVTYQGNPVPNVSVIFTPKDGGSGRPGTAVTDANGNFTSATTYEAGDGVIPGSHSITLAVVSAAEADSTALGADAYAAVDTDALPFPAKYLNTAETDVTVDITSSGQSIDIELSD